MICDNGIRSKHCFLQRLYTGKHVEHPKWYPTLSYNTTQLGADGFPHVGNYYYLYTQREREREGRERERDALCGLEGLEDSKAGIIIAACLMHFTRPGGDLEGCCKHTPCWCFGVANSPGEKACKNQTNAFNSFNIP